MSESFTSNLATHLTSLRFPTAYLDAFPPIPSGLMILDTGGAEMDRASKSYIQTITIVTYDPSRSLASKLAWDIYHVLNITGKIRLANLENVIDIKANQQPFPRGQDASQRFRWACNYRVVRVASRLPDLHASGTITSAPAIIAGHLR